MSFTSATSGSRSSPSIILAASMSRPVSYTRSQIRPFMHCEVMTTGIFFSVASLIRGIQSVPTCPSPVPSITIPL